METVMLQFKHQGQPPTVDDVRRLFNLDVDEIDQNFAVVGTDPSQGIYTVLIAATAAERVQAVLATRPGDPAEGIFSNPGIEPLGPPVD